MFVENKDKKGSYNIYDMILKSKEDGLSLDKVIIDESKSAKGIFGALKLRKRLTKAVFTEMVSTLETLRALDPSSPEYRIALENMEIMSECYEKLNKTFHEIVIAIVKGISGAIGVVIGIKTTAALENKGIGFVSASKTFWPKPKID